MSEHNSLFAKHISDIKYTFNLMSAMDGTGGVYILSDAALGSTLCSEHGFKVTYDGLQCFYDCCSFACICASTVSENEPAFVDRMISKVLVSLASQLEALSV